MPIVVHRKNNEKWKVTMQLDDFIKLQDKIKRLEEHNEWSLRLP